MNKSKLLLVLTNQPLTKHNFKRLGVGTNYRGWKIKYWTILPFVNKNIYKLYTQKGSRHKKNKNFVEIFSFSDVFEQLAKLPKNFFYLNLSGNYISISILERILKFKKGKKITFVTGPEIDLNFYTFENIRNYIKKNNFFKILKRLIFMIKKKVLSLISNKIKNIKSSLNFVFNNTTFEKVQAKFKKNELVKVDGPEYQLFLKTNNKRKNKNKTIVFIDDVVEGSFDYKLGRTQDNSRRKEDYWGPMGDFINFIKKKLPRYKIIIASHHRRNIYDIPIKNTKFVFDKTSDLIKDSKLVLCHNSFACQLAVLFKKPLIFLTSDYYATYHYHSHLLTNELSKALGTSLINVGKKFYPNEGIINKIISAKVNLKKYNIYKENYIHFPGTKTYGSWKTILRYLNNLQ